MATNFFRVPWRRGDRPVAPTTKQGIKPLWVWLCQVGYYNDEVKGPPLGRIIESLAPGGFLLIGSHERLPAESQALVPFPHHPNIF